LKPAGDGGGRQVLVRDSGGQPVMVRDSGGLLQIVVVTEMIYGWDSTQWSGTASMEMKVVD